MNERFIQIIGPQEHFTLPRMGQHLAYPFGRVLAFPSLRFPPQSHQDTHCAPAPLISQISQRPALLGWTSTRPRQIINPPLFPLSRLPPPFASKLSHRLRPSRNNRQPALGELIPELLRNTDDLHLTKFTLTLRWRLPLHRQIL